MSIVCNTHANLLEPWLQNTMIHLAGSGMKRILVLSLVAFISACERAPQPQPPVQKTPEPKATPVQNAPKTTPIPIQPLTSVPEVPHPTVMPTPNSTPAETGTDSGSPIISPAPSPGVTPEPTGGTEVPPASEASPQQSGTN